MNIVRRLWKHILLFAVLVYILIILKTDYLHDSLFYQKLRKFQFFENYVVRSLEDKPHIAQFNDVNYTFHFLKTPMGNGKCDRNTTVLLIILSVAEHFDIRKAIRNSYASSNSSGRIEDKSIRVNFIFSMPKDEDIVQKVEDEAQTYDDLIITDLLETYDNLILKVYSLLTYKHHYCSNVDYVIKIDEDVVIDIDLMYYRFTENQALANTNSISCRVWKNALPKRDRNNKWYVPRTFWPARYFPNYCDGPIYMIGKNPVKKMLDEAKNHKIWKLEDVFWTGIVPQKNNIPRLDWSNHLLRYEEDLDSKKRQRCHMKKPLFFGCHGLKGPKKINYGFSLLKNVTC